MIFFSELCTISPLNLFGLQNQSLSIYTSLLPLLSIIFASSAAVLPLLSTNSAPFVFSASSRLAAALYSGLSLPLLLVASLSSDVLFTSMLNCLLSWLNRTATKSRSAPICCWIWPSCCCCANDCTTCCSVCSSLLLLLLVSDYSSAPWCCFWSV